MALLLYKKIPRTYEPYLFEILGRGALAVRKIGSQIIVFTEKGYIRIIEKHTYIDNEHIAYFYEIIDERADRRITNVFSLAEAFKLVIQLLDQKI